MQDEQRKQIIDVWKTIIDVQKHFNDIGMRIRSMFITILLALFASIGFLLDKKLSLQLDILNIQFATLMPLFGILGTYLFYFIDRYWYHRLLVGSVKHAISIEHQYKDQIPELSLSDAIGAESPYEPRGLARFLANLLVSHAKYRTTKQLHSDGKIELFYKSVVVVLVLTAVLLVSFGGITFEKKALLIPNTAATTVAPTQPPSTVAPLSPPVSRQLAPTSKPSIPSTPAAPPAQKVQ